MKKIIFLIGVAGSGKSTFAAKYKRDNIGTEIFGSDEIRKELGIKYSYGTNKLVFNTLKSKLYTFIKESKDENATAIYDATNIGKDLAATIQDFKKQFKKDKVNVIFQGIKFNLSFLDLLIRNANREEDKQVPLDAITKMFLTIKGQKFANRLESIPFDNYREFTTKQIQLKADFIYLLNSIKLSRDIADETLISIITAINNVTNNSIDIDLEHNSTYHLEDIKTHLVNAVMVAAELPIDDSSENDRENTRKMLILTAMFHDIGKYFTKSGSSFSGHEIISADIFKSFMDSIEVSQPFAMIHDLPKLLSRLYTVEEAIKGHMIWPEDKTYLNTYFRHIDDPARINLDNYIEPKKQLLIQESFGNNHYKVIKTSEEPSRPEIFKQFIKEHLGTGDITYKQINSYLKRRSITTINGKVIATGLPKFFNLMELNRINVLPNTFNPFDDIEENKTLKFYKKHDGSLLRIVKNYDGGYTYFARVGLIDENHTMFNNISNYFKSNPKFLEEHIKEVGTTYLFEVMDPEYPIVIQPDKYEIIPLGEVINDTLKMTLYNPMTQEEAIEYFENNDEDIEGLVIDNGDFLMKLKRESYVTKHKARNFNYEKMSTKLTIITRAYYDKELDDLIPLIDESETQLLKFVDLQPKLLDILKTLLISNQDQVAMLKQEIKDRGHKEEIITNLGIINKKTGNIKRVIKSLEVAEKTRKVTAKFGNQIIAIYEDNYKDNYQFKDNKENKE